MIKYNINQSINLLITDTKTKRNVITNKVALKSININDNFNANNIKKEQLLLNKNDKKLKEELEIETKIKEKLLIKKEKSGGFNGSEKYTFVHVTKTSGSFFEKAIIENYKNKFIKTDKCIHDDVCENENNPIIILRDPMDRFKSIYKYWKYGSDAEIRSDEFKSIFKDYTIKDFINLIISEDHEKLFGSYGGKIYFWDKHIEPQTYWIKPNVYRNTIVIKYCKNMEEKMKEVIEYLNFEKKNINYEKCNVSAENEKVELDNEDKEWIKDYFKDDFKLWDLLNNNPKLFKRVI